MKMLTQKHCRLSADESCVSCHQSSGVRRKCRWCVPIAPRSFYACHGRQARPSFPIDICVARIVHNKAFETPVLHEHFSLHHNGLRSCWIAGTKNERDRALTCSFWNTTLDSLRLMSSSCSFMMESHWLEQALHSSKERKCHFPRLLRVSKTTWSHVGSEAVVKNRKKAQMVQAVLPHLCVHRKNLCLTRQITSVLPCLQNANEEKVLVFAPKYVTPCQP